MERRPLALLLALLLLLTGCARPSDAPEAPVGSSPEAPVGSSPEAPAATAPTATPKSTTEATPPRASAAPAPGCLPASASIPAAGVARTAGQYVWVNSGSCEVQTVEDGFDLRIQVPPDLTREQVMAALTITAPEAPRFLWGASQEYQELTLRFPTGKPGEKISLRLKGAVGKGGAAADLGFTITRFPSPRITAELQQPGGKWEVVTGIPVLPAGQAVNLRFQMQNGANPADAERKIRHALKDAAFELTQPSPGTFLLRIAAPPPLIAIDFREVRGEHGIILDGGFTLYTGEPPRLLLLDPASGSEELVLANAPADVSRGSLSPDGKWLMLSGFSPESVWRDRVWVLNMQTRELRLTPLEDNAYRSSPVVWREDRLILPVYGQVQTYHLATGKSESIRSEAWWWEEPSPDGRWTIGYTVDYGREDPSTWIAPVTLFLYDAATGKERSFPDLLQYMVPHKGGYPTIGTVWEGDGRHALLYEWRWKGKPMESREGRYQRFDLATGKTELYTGPVPEPKRYVEWLPGPGGYQYKNNQGWGALTLRSPDGAEQERGYGLPLAWSREGKLLLVRWNPEQRRVRYAE